MCRAHDRSLARSLARNIPRTQRKRAQVHARNLLPLARAVHSGGTTHACARVHALAHNTRALTHTRMCARMLACERACLHARMHGARMHACTRARTHAQVTEYNKLLSMDSAHQCFYQRELAIYLQRAHTNTMIIKRMMTVMVTMTVTRTTTTTTMTLLSMRRR